MKKDLSVPEDLLMKRIIKANAVMCLKEAMEVSPCQISKSFVGFSEI